MSSKKICKFPGEEEVLPKDCEKANEAITKTVKETNMASIPSQAKRYVNIGGTKVRSIKDSNGNIKPIDATQITEDYYLGSCPPKEYCSKWWEIVYEEGFGAIVSILNPFLLGDISSGKQIDLTPELPRGGSGEKKLTFEDIEICTVDGKKLELMPESGKGYPIEIRYIDVSFGREENRKMIHILIYMPDHDVVPLNVFRLYIDFLSKLNLGKTIFHCSAGQGRSATVLAGLLMKKYEGEFNVFDIIYNLRSFRMKSCVEEVQFKLLWEFKDKLTQ